MKLSEYRQDYYTHTGTASTVARQASFAGIAIIWLFNGKSGGSYTLPEELLLPALFLIVGLALDLFQYIFASAIFGMFTRYHEKRERGGEDPDLSTPAYYNWPMLFCFWGKLISVYVGYMFLICYAFKSIHFGAYT